MAIQNSLIKLFGSIEMVHRYAGADRNMDTNIAILAFCLIFLALAKILDNQKKSSRNN